MLLVSYQDCTKQQWRYLVSTWQHFSTWFYLLHVLWACWNSSIYWLLMVVTLLSLIKCICKFLFACELFDLLMWLGASNAWAEVGKTPIGIGVWFPFKYLFVASMYVDNKNIFFKCKIFHIYNIHCLFVRWFFFETLGVICRFQDNIYHSSICKLIGSMFKQVFEYLF